MNKKTFKRDGQTTPDKLQRIMRIHSREVEGKKVYQAALSSEYAVERWGYSEILEHSAEAINMERAANGLVMLFNHNYDMPIGRIINIRLREDKALAGDLIFSETAEGKLRQTQVDEGVLTDISISYSIEETERRENRDTGQVTITAKRWTPLEASVVSVPADPSVGIGRNQPPPKPKGGTTMNWQQRAQKMGLVQKDGETDAEFQARIVAAELSQRQHPAGGTVVEFEAGRRSGMQEGATLERQRQTAINELFMAPGFSGPGYSALREALIQNGSSVEQARQNLLEYVGSNPDQRTAISAGMPKHEPAASPCMRVTSDNSGVEVAAENMRQAGLHKVGLLKPEENETAGQFRKRLNDNPFVGYRFSEMARHALQLIGIDTRGLSEYDVIGYALNPMAAPAHKRSGFVGQGTSAFPALVEDIASKAMMMGYQESDEVWRQIVRVGRVSSFRQESRVDMSAFSDLDTIPENGEYKHGKLSDRKEYIQAQKYGKLFSITREMLVNDDLNGLSVIPRSMGRAADRKVGDLVMAIFTGNPTMQDGTALFAAGHSNIITSGAAPSVAQLDAMVKLMALQKDSSDVTHGQNIRLSTLLVPKALEVTARILATAINDPDQTSTSKGGGGTRPNPFNNQFSVVSDARLDASSSVKFWGLANPSIYDTIEVAFLNGNETPMLESRDGWNVDGIEYKVRHEVGVKALSWKTMVQNAGQ